jgi:hypothetical protein
VSGLFDVGDLPQLAVDLPKLGRSGALVMHKVITDAGDDLRDVWKRNATVTSGRHGKHYPKSITATLKVSTDVVVRIAPDPAMKQGGMSFENGSVNQPPHNDGKKAADVVVPKIERRIDSALGLLGLG